MILNNKKREKGFTLIELMVATTLFTIVMLMGVGSLIVSSNSAKSSQALQTAVDNVNFAMEGMSRELRMGTYYYCNDTANIIMVDITQDCSGKNIISFNPQINPNSVDRVTYMMQGNSIIRFEHKDNGSVSRSRVTAPEVTIEKMEFYVKGANKNDGIQPSVEIMLKGSVTIKGVTWPFSLQTMASQRSFEE